MESGDLTFKVGVATGHTSGTYQRFQCKVGDQRAPHRRTGESPEYVFVPHAMVAGEEMAGRREVPPFADEGDQRAVAFDSSGEIMGLLSGGRAPGYSGRWATPL